MNIFAAYLRRKTFLTILTALLLALAIAFSCIGYSSYTAAQNQLKNIDSNYTTLAVPVEKDADYVTQQKMKGYAYDADGNMIFLSDNSVLYARENVTAVAAEAPQVSELLNCGILTGNLLNCGAIASGTFDEEQYNANYDDFTHSFYVLAVKCVSSLAGEETGLKTYGDIAYKYEFEVLDCPSVMDSYESGDIMGDVFSIVDSYPVPEEHYDDYPPMFEEGKTYLIRGFYYDLGSGINNDSFTQPMFNFYGEDKFHGDNLGLDSNGDSLYGPSYPGFEMNLITYSEDGNSVRSSFTIKNDGDLPYYAEYTGDWRDFLETEEGAVWKDEIIPWTKLNQQTATVVLTDNIYGLYNFNTGAAYIMEGRDFTEEEYAGGGDVCIVSASFAAYNNLSVGDVISMDYYDTEIVEEELVLQPNGYSGEKYYCYKRMPLSEDFRIGVQKECEIVGIYSGTDFTFGTYNFFDDTIFVPKNSVEDAERYEEPIIPWLSSLTITNGETEAFEAYMAEHDMGGYYEYADMSYKNAQASLEALSGNAREMLLLGAGSFVLAAAVAFYLLLRRFAPVVNSARRLGVGGRRIRRDYVTALTAFFLAASIAGCALGAALYGYVTKRVLAATLDFALTPLIVSAAAQFAVLAVLGLLVSGSASNPPLMQTEKRGKKRE